MTKIATFGKYNRNKIARLNSLPPCKNQIMKHVWFLTIMHVTKLQQTIATSQHIWLLTSKLIKKTANVTTHTAVK